MKERKLLFTAHSKLIIRCLPFLLSFFLFFILDISVNAATVRPDITFTTPNLYVSKSQTVYPYHIWCMVDDIMSVGETYRVRLDFNTGITCDVSATSYWTEFALEYNGKLYEPHYLKDGRVVFDFIVEGNGTNEFDLIAYINYYVSNVNDLTVMAQYTVSVYTNEFYVISQPSDNTIIGELNQSNQLIQDQINQTNTLTNGYESSQMGQAENKFNSSAEDLTSIEDTLSGSSSQMVDTFTSTGFDTSLLDSVAPSMQYLVTWFTNFWNIGGALTKCFTLCFALFIAFYILRVRS